MQSKYELFIVKWTMNVKDKETALFLISRGTRLLSYSRKKQISIFVPRDNGLK